MKVGKKTLEACSATGLIAYGISLLQAGSYLEGLILVALGVIFYYWHHRK